MVLPASHRIWLFGLSQNLLEFMETLRVHGQPGRFRPCVRGVCGAGEKAALGFSCLAHKVFFSLGLWDSLDQRDQIQWIDFIRSFQNPDGLPATGALANAFIDNHLLEGIREPPPLGLRLTLRHFLSGKRPPQPREDAVRAETKQAIATLAQVGVQPYYSYQYFPTCNKSLMKELNSYDWSEPWSAGAKAALLSVFIQAQAGQVPGIDNQALAQTVRRFLEKMASSATGSYHRGKRLPIRGQVINGAMKVLNALDWLEQPIHFPEKLIDTTLEQGPPPAGCHIVDWIYVLHRCGLQTDHRKKEIQEKCCEVVDLIKTHQNIDRGFSYQPHKAQTGYYNATISHGFDEGDIHGTCLLTWALTMIADILELGVPGWQVIRP